jgi:predicted dehydrogenase
MKPIGVGIIGVHPEQGWAATAHIPALQQLPAYRIAAISHHNAGTAQQAAKKFGVPHAFTLAKELVAHPEVDLVVIAVKVAQHRALAELAIAAGKAVFSEWPLGTSLAEAEAMRDLARAKGVASAIGLQTRAAPVFAYARDLIKDGFIGDVLSASMIGSGMLWGGEMSATYAYTLDPAVGANMLTVPFAHSIDGLTHMLGADFATVSALVGNARKTTRIIETGVDVPLSVPDQVMLAGQLSNGVAVSAHFRGGMSRATNFHVEVNGSKGDLVITSPVGYAGFGGMQLLGATGQEALKPLEVPAAYAPPGVSDAPLLIASAYRNLAADMANGTRTCPNFDDAVSLHRLIDTIGRTGGVLR